MRGTCKIYHPSWPEMGYLANFKSEQFALVHKDFSSFGYQVAHPLTGKSIHSKQVCVHRVCTYVSLPCVCYIAVTTRNGPIEEHSHWLRRKRSCHGQTGMRQIVPGPRQWPKPPGSAKQDKEPPFRPPWSTEHLQFLFPPKKTGPVLGLEREILQTEKTVHQTCGKNYKNSWHPLTLTVCQPLF